MKKPRVFMAWWVITVLSLVGFIWTASPAGYAFADPVLPRVMDPRAGDPDTPELGGVTPTDPITVERDDPSVIRSNSTAIIDDNRNTRHPKFSLWKLLIAWALVLRGGGVQ